MLGTILDMRVSVFSLPIRYFITLFLLRDNSGQKILGNRISENTFPALSIGTYVDKIIFSKSVQSTFKVDFLKLSNKMMVSLLPTHEKDEDDAHIWSLKSRKNLSKNLFPFNFIT